MVTDFVNFMLAGVFDSEINQFFSVEGSLLCLRDIGASDQSLLDTHAWIRLLVVKCANSNVITKQSQFLQAEQQCIFQDFEFGGVNKVLGVNFC